MVDWLWRLRQPMVFWNEPDGTGGGSTGITEPDPPPRRPATMVPQEEVEALLESRLMRERSKWERQLGGPGALEELERLRKAEADRKRKEAEDKQNYEAAMRSREEEYEKERASLREREDALKKELRKDRVRGALIGAAAELGAIKAEQIADLLENRRVTLDDDQLSPIVLGDNGQPAYVGGKPMSVKQLVAQYLEENPHLARASDTGGSGSRGGASTSESGQSAVVESMDIRRAREEAKELQERAEKSRSVSDVTAAQRAISRLARLEKDAKAKA